MDPGLSASRLLIIASTVGYGRKPPQNQADPVSGPHAIVLVPRYHHGNIRLPGLRHRLVNELLPFGCRWVWQLIDRAGRDFDPGSLAPQACCSPYHFSMLWKEVRYLPWIRGAWCPLTAPGAPVSEPGCAHRRHQVLAGGFRRLSDVLSESRATDREGGTDWMLEQETSRCPRRFGDYRLGASQFAARPRTSGEQQKTTSKRPLDFGPNGCNFPVLATVRVVRRPRSQAHAA